MSSLKNFALRAGALSPVQSLLGISRRRGLSTVLFHRFFFGDESRKVARDRLLRQLDWLRCEYSPISLNQVGAVLDQPEWSKPPLLVTVDDAIVDLLEVAADFRSFEIPIGLFVCAGWTAQADPHDPDSLLARVISEIEWYDGPATRVMFDGGRREVSLERSRRAESIDALLAARIEVSGSLDELAEKLLALQLNRGASTICNWQQLAELKKFGVDMGSHSVTHIRLAPASALRRFFEIGESKRLLDAKLGGCNAFAYPYGDADVVSNVTSAELEAAGFDLAFLTHAEFSDHRTSRLHLPRFSLPDRGMTMSEFQSRVEGGGIPLRRLKALLTPAKHH